MITLPAPAKKVRVEVQRLLGFTGEDADGDLGKVTHGRFNKLKGGDPVLGEIQVLLGFKGTDVDLDLGPRTRLRFQQLGDHPDAEMWPGAIGKIDPAAPKPPAGDEPDTRLGSAMRRPLDGGEREALFGGPFRHKPVPGGKPGDIVILGNWENENIERVEVPQLRMVPGNFSTMRLNKRVVKQTLALWAAWEKAGLLPNILTYEGAFVARMVRGSTTSLSNHAYGSAFDINYHWNGLHKTPARAGTKGSVRELVPLAHKHGFFWGGNFSRLDGMHFEVCKIL